MWKNEATIDRAVRLVLAAILFGLALAGPKIWWLGLVALVPLVTGLVGFCPLYRLLGISTARSEAPNPRTT